MLHPDDHDNVQYDDFYAPSAGMLEDEEIRREAVEDEKRGKRPDKVLITRPY